MEALKNQIQQWNDCDKTNLIVLKNCEYIFQDEENAKENCWLNNLAMLYEFDLNKVFNWLFENVQEALYKAENLVAYKATHPFRGINDCP